MDAVNQILVPIINEHLLDAASAGDRTPSKSATIAEQLDSLEIVELVLAIEEAFDIRLQEDDLQPATFEDLGSLAAAVRRAQAAG